MNSWLAAGRRPLVADGGYARELATVRPGTLTLVDVRPEPLGAAIATALADPDSTWLGQEVSTRPHLDDAAAAYARWWRETRDEAVGA